MGVRQPTFAPFAAAYKRVGEGRWGYLLEPMGQGGGTVPRGSTRLKSGPDNRYVTTQNLVWGGGGAAPKIKSRKFRGKDGSHKSYIISKLR